MSSRRHRPQRFSLEPRGYGPNTRSPQTEQMLPLMGRTSARHGWQTGRREMLTRGEPQRRQSDGKRVAKRLSATPLTDETRVDISELSRVKTWVPVARIGSSLLLKTSLPRSPGNTKDAAGKLLPQYSGLQCPKQRLNAQATASCVFLGSRLGRTFTNVDWYDLLKQSPQRVGRRSNKGRRNLSVRFFGRER